MPTYQYTCTECEHDLEAVQKFTDNPLTECPECRGRLRKVFSAVGVVFKGSGFYRTDSRTKEKTPEPAKSGDTKRADSAGGPGSTSSGESAPAAAKKKAESAA